ncbi:MAG: dihydrodipicolinate synthase family protein [Actinobacteria bacterium]|nr:dihydrodipicolinate synthase family protein [Actinomycetota bacterium]
MTDAGGNDRLRGVFAPVATPFENGRIRFDWLEENLQRMGQSRLAGYLALGTNGEFRSLSDHESIEVIKVFVKTKGDKTLMVGTGRESTRETIVFTNKAAELGADFASIITPHYFASRMKDRELIGYFEEVADNSPIPILLYNIPKCAGGVTISAGALKHLSAHGNILGLKDSGGASIFTFLISAEQGFSVLAGSANYFLASLMLGAKGGIISLADAFPDICSALYEAAASGKLAEAHELNRKLILANSEVSGKHGVAGVKTAMDLAGFHGGEPRRPLLPIGAEQKNAMRLKLRELGFLD